MFFYTLIWPWQAFNDLYSLFDDLFVDFDPDSTDEDLDVKTSILLYRVPIIGPMIWYVTGTLMAAYDCTSLY